VGARWWNYYNPAWTSLGLWNIATLCSVGSPEGLSAEHPWVQKTARAIARQIQR
jgi:hypothetical protein